MRWRLALVLAALLSACAPPAGAEVAVSSHGVRVQARVQSFHEIRQARVVSQKWDRSCGSAALSTLLTYYLGDPTDETTIIADALRHGDPLRVRRQGGFSLLDLKRYVERNGYRGRGYGRMSIDELATLKRPAVVPIRTHGYDHFVVFVALLADRVVLADPAYGNTTLTRAQFERIWQNGIAFFVFRGHLERGGKPPLPVARLPVPRLHATQRMLRGLGPVPATRVGR